MKRKILAFFIAILIGAGMSGNVFAAPDDGEADVDAEATATADACDKSILGLRPWYHGLTNAQCEVEFGSDGDGIQNATVIIIGNVAYDLFRVVGYVAIGYIIYGGFSYLTAQGDPTKAKKAKRSIEGALIGMAVGLVAAAIVKFLMDNVLGVGVGGDIPTVEANVVVNNLLNGVYGIVAIVAVVMIIYGGVEYMTSAGNAQQVQKAKNILVYSIVGLVIVLLAYAITYFVMRAVTG